MADKVFVVSYTDMDNEGLLQHNLYTLPIPDLTNLASKVLTPREAVEQLHNGEIDTDMNCVVYREIGDEEIDEDKDTYINAGYVVSGPVWEYFS